MVKTNNPFTKQDRRFMGLAIGLARRSLGNTWPNPAVGCVLVRPDLGTADNGGRIVGRCAQRGGIGSDSGLLRQLAGAVAKERAGHGAGTSS